MKQIRELSSIKKRKYLQTDISKYQNKISVDKFEKDSVFEIIEEDSIFEISKEELEIIDDDEENWNEDMLLIFMKATQTSNSFEQFKISYF